MRAEARRTDQRSEISLPEDALESRSSEQSAQPREVSAAAAACTTAKIDSVNSATKEELEAKLQGVEQQIESAKLKMQEIEKLRVASFRRLREMAEELGRVGITREEKQKVHAAHDELSKDPLFAEWERLAWHTMKLQRQKFDIKKDLEITKAAVTSSSAQPSEASEAASEEALKLPPRLWGRMTAKIDSPKPATKEELEAKLQELENHIAWKKNEMKKKVEASQASFDKLHEIVLKMNREDLSPEDRQKLRAEHAELDKDPIFVEWKVLLSDLTETISQYVTIKQDLREMRAEAHRTDQRSEISLPKDALESRSSEQSAQPREVSLRSDSVAALEPPACTRAKSKNFSLSLLWLVTLLAISHFVLCFWHMYHVRLLYTALQLAS